MPTDRKHKYNEFTDRIKWLLVYDLANHLYSHALQVFGDSCMRLLENKHSPNVSLKKIGCFISTLSQVFTDKEIEECLKLIENDIREPRWLIKGHFITNAIINLIKNIVYQERGKKISISLDHLYSSTINGCTYCSITNCEALDQMAYDLKQAVASI